jgi:hypothetical protein
MEEYMKCRVSRTRKDKDGTRKGCTVFINGLEAAENGLNPGVRYYVYPRSDGSLEYRTTGDEISAIANYNSHKFWQQISLSILPKWAAKYIGDWKPGVTQYVDVEIDNGTVIISAVKE